MKKKLVLITAHFPYGTSETFLESELPILAENFEQIEILTFSKKGNKREIPKKCFVSEIKLNTKPILAYLGIFSLLFWKEIFIVKRIYKKNISIGILKTMLISLMRGKAIARYLSNFKPEEKQDSIYYSYWCDDSALALAIFNKKNQQKIRTVSRTHGWDVYFEVSEYNYLPFRHFIHENLSHIFPISEKGKKYIEETWKVKGKITVSKLGVNGPHFDRLSVNFNKLSVRKDNGNKNPPPLSPPKNLIRSKLSKGGIDERNTFTIVSCSNLIPLKRVHLIIEALSLLQSERIRWVHFGDGPESTNLKALADKKLLGNVSFEFKGRVENKEVLNFYNTNKPQLFINVSSSEGIPVSIMEAMSFGIPCIATNVGGNSEIVNDNINGMLLNATPSVDEIATVVMTIKAKSQSEYNVMSQKAFETWEKEYNANKNFSCFINEALFYSFCQPKIKKLRINIISRVVSKINLKLSTWFKPYIKIISFEHRERNELNQSYYYKKNFNQLKFEKKQIFWLNIDNIKINGQYIISEKVKLISKGILLNNKNEVILESCISQIEYLNKINANHLIIFKNLLPIKKVEKAIVLRNQLENNYYHWILESIARLILIPKNILENYKIIIGENSPKFVEESLIFILGIQKENIFRHKNHELIQIEDCLIPSYPLTRSSETKWMNFYHKDNLIALNNFKTLINKRSPRHIIINRKNATQRRFINLEILLTSIKLIEFEIIELENLSVSEQINLFSNCETIISIHGAGLVNLIFSKQKNLKVFEFYPNERNIRDAFYFQQITSILDINHQLIFYTSINQNQDLIIKKEDIDIIIDSIMS